MLDREPRIKTVHDSRFTIHDLRNYAKSKKTTLEIANADASRS